MQQTSSPATPPTPTPSHSYPNGNSDLDYNLPGTRYTDPVPALDQAGPIVRDYACDGPAPGRLAFRWIHGSRVAGANTDPRIQVVQYNGDTFVLRQNVCVHWEAPFTYLLFGNKGALLIDSGATANDNIILCERGWTRSSRGGARSVNELRSPYSTGTVFLCNQTRSATTIDTNPYRYS